ncbi:TolC family protein [Sinomicrobium sp.]
MQKIVLSICAICGMLLLPISAQEVLTPKEAMTIALENNYDIRLADNAFKADQLGVSVGMAGMLPSVDLVLNKSNSIQELEQVRADGAEQSSSNAKNNNLTYGVALDWTIFDGLAMFARHDKLKEIEKLGDAELKVAVLNNVREVLITYYDIVKQQQQLTALDSTLVISEQRVELANNRFTIGKASKLELLNARVDFNADQTQKLKQKALYNTTKIRLNELLGRDTSTEFEVVDEIDVDKELFLPELETLARERNPELLAEVIGKQIAELELKEVKARRYPSIVATAGYNFSESESSLGFSRTSTAKGLNYGFGVRMNVFNGFSQNRNEKIAKIAIDQSKLIIAQKERALLAQLETAYQTYQTNLGLIQLEYRNETIARENLEITMEKYRIGTIPTIEFRTAQLNYINAQLRHSEARLQAKLSEIALKAISGRLTL